VALPLTTACQTRVGEAASVGDRQISTSTLTSFTQRTFAALASQGHPVPANQQATAQRSVLNLLLQVDLLRAAADTRHVSVSAADIATERAAEAQAAGGEAAYVKQLEANGIATNDIPLFVERSVLIAKLQKAYGATDSAGFVKALTADTKNLRIRVNPRFGTWDTKKLTIVDAANDLSSTVTKS
jgi:hypothetical protein